MIQYEIVAARQTACGSKVIPKATVIASGQCPGEHELKQLQKYFKHDDFIVRESRLGSADRKAAVEELSTLIGIGEEIAGQLVDYGIANKPSLVAVARGDEASDLARRIPQVTVEKLTGWADAVEAEAEELAAD